MGGLILILILAAVAALFLRGSTTSTRRNGAPRQPQHPVAPAVRKVEVRQRRFLINGKPRQIFAGEVHYFRLKPEDWKDRLVKLKKSGFTAVATYMPWIWHELPDGTVDLTGASHPQRNLVGFLDLCAELGLDVIARPGPFVMAELKNEGIPYRLYREPTNLRPVTWRGEPVKSATLDYLSPQFLDEVKGWYAQIMPVLASHLCTRGGAVIAVQLDNEIGMLSWASNSPDLTEAVCVDMRKWAVKKYGGAGARDRFHADPADFADWVDALRNPRGDTLALHQDLGLYNRDRFRRYVAALKSMAEMQGVRDVPFLVNIHGTSSGRGRTFPIGISQLMDSYRDVPGVMCGSDIYLGELTTANLPDLYAINAFMKATCGEDQPTSSLEFEAGDGNYGDDLANLNSPEATELKTRLCIAQGNRILNYYLHAGGENPPLEGCGDGLDRIAITGQRHGYAAPVGPEGQLNPTYDATSRVVHRLKGIEKLLADAEEEHDGFALGFVPDHYLTEYALPGSKERAEQIADLERFRGMGSRDVLVRNLLLAGFSFPAIDLQSAELRTSGCIVMSTGRTLSAQVQKKLVDFVVGGGRLLLTGLLPDRDHDGSKCTILADALGVRDAGRVFDGPTADGFHWTSVESCGWAAGRAQTRVGFAQLVADAGAKTFTPFMLDADSKQPCAVEVRAGKGEAIIFGTEYTADLELFKRMMAQLLIWPRWKLEANYPGLMVTSTYSPGGQRLIHIINVAPYAVTAKLWHAHRERYFGYRDVPPLVVPAKTGFILPFDVNVGRGATILQSTAELLHVDDDNFTVRPTQEQDVIHILTDRRVRLEQYHAGRVHDQTGEVMIQLDRSKHHGEPIRIMLS